MSMKRIQTAIGRPEFVESLALTADEFNEEWATFERYIKVWLQRAAPEARALAGVGRRSQRALETRLRYLFYAQVFGSKFTRAELENQKDVANLRYPSEWYSQTRALQRTVHLHVGPTNSGKTYHALKRLEEAESGIYLGPLRLLAYEVFMRLNAKGRPCVLVTGEEIRMPEEEPSMWSCTVEMAPLNQKLEVAVIDEIQMINHKERGWAWTNAFLGLRAKEVHLCGEARTVPLIKELCALVGDKVVVHEYNRLTPLKAADKSLAGNLTKNLQKGDCIVSFSVLGIHALRKAIENATGKKCAIVYGSLPPETRAQQARLFNDPDNDYDFLVASDAIGMGLNLYEVSAYWCCRNLLTRNRSIKRVIFESTMKNNGHNLVPLEVSEVKQIAGRAGRYRTAHQAMAEDQAKVKVSGTPADAIGLDDTDGETDVRAVEPAKPKEATVGYATTLEHFDHPYLKRCLEMEPEPITTAGLMPPALIIERFANYFPPGTPFSYILLRLHEISEIDKRFFLCSMKDQLTIADAIHTVKNLTIPDRIVMCAAPTSLKDEQEIELLRALARCIADGESGELLDLPIPIERLDLKPSGERRYLYLLEQLHKSLVLYLWLSYRFPNVFTTRGLANYTKKLVEDKIEQTLTDFSFTEEHHQRLKTRRMREMERLQKQAVAEEAPSASSADGTDSGDVEVPQAMEDVLRDEESFASEPVRDDVDEYPTPELELEEPELEPESVDDDAGQKDNQTPTETEHTTPKP